MRTLRKILLPFSLMYHFVTAVRNILYDIGFFTSKSFDIPVIVVGNLSVGGTGKTPLIEYLIRLLQDTYKVAVLSRGYKRSTKGFLQIDQNHTAKEVGDEPLQFFKKFPTIFVAVDANRAHGIELLLKEVQPDVILLDDAFQHRKVKGSINILLTKYKDLFVDDFVLPAGNLREGSKGATRADAIVVTKCPEEISEEEQKSILQKLKKKVDKPIFFSSISYASKTRGYQEFFIDDFKNYEILLVTGIANPKPLVEFLTSLSAKIHHLKFADHHYFTKDEVEKISAKYNQLPDNKILITTEKDYMRLQGKVPKMCYLPIETKFIKNQDAFDLMIKSSCSKDF